MTTLAGELQGIVTILGTGGGITVEDRGGKREKGKKVEREREREERQTADK